MKKTVTMNTGDSALICEPCKYGRSVIEHDIGVVYICLENHSPDKNGKCEYQEL